MKHHIFRTLPLLFAVLLLLSACSQDGASSAESQTESATVTEIPTAGESESADSTAETAAAPQTETEFGTETETETESVTETVTETNTETDTETVTETIAETETAPVELTYTWTNPISYRLSGSKVPALRDPFILKIGDVWYMTGTLPPYGLAAEDSRTKGVPLYVSSDLEKWSFVDYIIKTPAESEGKWYSERFWAAELFRHNGKFYVSVNCCAPNGDNHGMLFAVADQIEGPYTLLNPDAPLVLSNDAHLFVDDDGRTYLFGSGNWYAEIDLESLTLLTEPNFIVVPVKGSDAWNGERPRVGFEGPYVLKRNGVYYMFYSTWARGYEIGIATATALDGEWTLWEKPFYGAMSRSLCDLYGATYEPGYYIAQDKYSECGHNSIFIGPDGNYWLSAHAYENGGRPVLVIDRISFDENGKVYVPDSAGAAVNGPTYGTQSVTYTPVSDEDLTVLGTLPVHRYIHVGDPVNPPAMVDVRLMSPTGIQQRDCASVVWEEIPALDTPGDVIVKGTVTYRGAAYEAQYIIHIAAA